MSIIGNDFIVYIKTRHVAWSTVAGMLWIALWVT